MAIALSRSSSRVGDSIAQLKSLSQTRAKSARRCAARTLGLASLAPVFSDLRSRACCCTGTGVGVRAARPVDGAEEFEAKEALEDAAALEGLKGFTELALDMGAYLDVMGEARYVTHPVRVLPMELRGVTNGSATALR